MGSSARRISLHGEERYICAKPYTVVSHFLWISDLSTYTWTELPCKGTPPSPRYFHSCCIHGNKLYTYGGYSGNERLADMFAYGESEKRFLCINTAGHCL